MKTLTVIALLLTAIGAIAQQPRKSITDTVFQLEPAYVKAKTKKVELMGMDIPLRFVPITVTQLSSETLERKGITELSDAIKFMPGITENSSQYGAFQQFSIRGQGSAVVMIDGIRDERTVGNNVPYGDLSSAETVELLKGPASVLAGHSAMGGVLNIVRKKAVPTFSANARLSYGSWQDKQATLGFGGRLAGPVDYRINLHYATGDGFRNIYTDRFSGFAALGANIGKKGRLDFTTGFADDDYRTDIGGAPVMPGDIYLTADDSPYAKSGERHPEADYRTNYNDYANNYMHRRVWDMSVQYTHQFSDWMKLRERFTYSHSDLNYHCIEGLSYLTSDDPIYDWYYVSKGQKKYINLDTVRRGNWKGLNPLNFNPDHQNTNNVLELTGELVTGTVKNHYTLGWALSFFDMKQYNGYTVSGDNVDLWGPGLDVLLPVRNPQTVQGWWDTKVSAVSLRTELTNGIYLHDVLELNDAWKIMLAGRMEFFKQDRASGKVDGKQEYKPENRTSDWVTKKQKAFTYRAGFVYQPLSKFSVYGSMASFFNPITSYSYRSTTMYLDRNGKEFNPDEESMFDPEKGWSAEAGIRYT
ncbi:MAG: TonB-dependent receptor plug domain-containing protein, partial [Odoribacter sp.]|nr:TonB-dependent receptor plug domain-containing protein [Odoribacter sp.]